MSEHAAAACRAEELTAVAAARLQAAGLHNARTVGEALLKGGLPGPTAQATCRPEPRA